MSKEELQNKIAELEREIQEKIRERGEAAREGGGWHDNSAFDLLNEEISVLEAHLRNLKDDLRLLK